MSQFQRQEGNSLSSNELVTLRLGYISLSKLSNVTLGAVGPLLENIREITDVLTHLPLAVPTDTSILISRLDAGKLRIEFSGAEVRYQILPSDTCQVLSMSSDGENSSIQFQVDGKEIIVLLHRGLPRKSENSDYSPHEISRTTNPFRGRSADTSGHTATERESESRGGCGGGER